MVSRIEDYLGGFYDGDINTPVPLSRLEIYLHALFNGSTSVPEPLSRSEACLYALCKNGGIVGGDTSVTAEIVDNILYIKRGVT